MKPKLVHQTYELFEFAPQKRTIAVYFKERKLFYLQFPYTTFVVEPHPFTIGRQKQFFCIWPFFHPEPLKTPHDNVWYAPFPNGMTSGICLGENYAKSPEEIINKFWNTDFNISGYWNTLVPCMPPPLNNMGFFSLETFYGEWQKTGQYPIIPLHLNMIEFASVYKLNTQVCCWATMTIDHGIRVFEQSTILDNKIKPQHIASRTLNNS